MEEAGKPIGYSVRVRTVMASTKVTCAAITLKYLEITPIPHTAYRIPHTAYRIPHTAYRGRGRFLDP